MITPAFGLTATERVLPKLALDFTTAVLDARVTVTRTTNATNPATYINSSGVITAATNNQPRFDYDPVTLLCKGLLIEESRANSLLNTDLLSTQTVTVTAAARALSFYGTGSITLSGAHIAVVSGTGAYPTRTTYSFTPSAGALTLTVTGTVQFAQLELGASATSYIPTTTTSLTRNADVAEMTGTNFSSWYNASEGTFVAYISTSQPIESGTARRAVNVTDGTETNRIFLSYAGATNVAPALITTSGASQTAFLAPAGGYPLPSKSAISYKLNDIAFCINGGAVAVDTTATIPTVNQMRIGALVTGGSNANNLQGCIGKIFYYPLALTDSEIQAITK